ncbi:hypothetical protein [Halomonas sp. OfavH-34-E]|uniref:hypothetical protein n=1 Tax=Halomonas sp. OfavH-34-E TaxID=2954491 RepID=UPI002097BCDF|nr:hypothetical protein [Halomonas sp. OfavH-34-E]MCO7214153.1 hypothetical protein [Halomonas sp. OfavH-34-E]
MSIIPVDEAANMAASRTTHSLAREVLGLRAQLAELENQNSQLSAWIVENDAERDKLAVRAREAEEELLHVQCQRDSAIQRAQIAEDGQNTAQARVQAPQTEQHGAHREGVAS